MTDVEIMCSVLLNNAIIKVHSLVIDQNRAEIIDSDLVYQQLCSI